MAALFGTLTAITFLFMLKMIALTSDLLFQVQTASSLDFIFHGAG